MWFYNWQVPSDRGYAMKEYICTQQVVDTTRSHSTSFYQEAREGRENCEACKGCQEFKAACL